MCLCVQYGLSVDHVGILCASMYAQSYAPVHVDEVMTAAAKNLITSWHFDNSGIKKKQKERKESQKNLDLRCCSL